MDFSGMSQGDQEVMARILEKKQMQDFLRLYNGLTEKCVGDCVEDFTVRHITGHEQSCIEYCASKFIKLSQRIGQRFAEQQALQQEAAGAGQ
eukprot:Clim_evm21s26 gene=Clim_evmTU21s26